MKRLFWHLVPSSEELLVRAKIWKGRKEDRDIPLLPRAAIGPAEAKAARARTGKRRDCASMFADLKGTD